MSSLHALYIQERLGKHIIENEKGFATYYFVNDGCYIEDIFVHPDFRNQGVAATMADVISDCARAKGCRKLYGSVVPSANGSTDSMKVLLAYGFVINSSAENFIAMVKGL